VRWQSEPIAIRCYQQLLCYPYHAFVKRNERKPDSGDVTSHRPCPAIVKVCHCCEWCSGLLLVASRESRKCDDVMPTKCEVTVGLNARSRQGTGYWVLGTGYTTRTIILLWVLQCSRFTIRDSQMCTCILTRRLFVYRCSVLPGSTSTSFVFTRDSRIWTCIYP
jgi:hypothetical protein